MKNIYMSARHNLHSWPAESGSGSESKRGLMSHRQPLAPSRSCVFTDFQTWIGSIWAPSSHLLSFLLVTSAVSLSPPGLHWLTPPGCIVGCFALLGYVGSSCSCGCYCYLPKHCCRPSTHLTEGLPGTNRQSEHFLDPGSTPGFLPVTGQGY